MSIAKFIWLKKKSNQINLTTPPSTHILRLFPIEPRWYLRLPKMFEVMIREYLKKLFVL